MKTRRHIEHSDVKLGLHVLHPQAAESDNIGISSCKMERLRRSGAYPRFKKWGTNHGECEERSTEGAEGDRIWGRGVSLPNGFLPKTLPKGEGLGEEAFDF